MRPSRPVRVLIGALILLTVILVAGAFLIDLDVIR